MFLGHKLRRRAASGGLDLDFTYIGADQNTGSASTYTFTTVGIGDAHPDRMVALTIQITNGAATAVNSITIGGTSCTLTSTIYAFGVISIVAWCKKPTGTTATIVVTLGNTALGCRVGKYRFNTTATTNLDSGTALSLTPISDIQCVNGGVVLHSIASGAGATTATWNGVDSTVEAYDLAFDARQASSYYVLTTEDSTVRDMTTTATGNVAIVTVSFDV